MVPSKEAIEDTIEMGISKRKSIPNTLFSPSYYSIVMVGPVVTKKKKIDVIKRKFCSVMHARFVWKLNDSVHFEFFSFPVFSGKDESRKPPTCYGTNLSTAKHLVCIFRFPFPFLGLNVWYKLLLDFVPCVGLRIYLSLGSLLSTSSSRSVVAVRLEKDLLIDSRQINSIAVQRGIVVVLFSANNCSILNKTIW